jgi:hypothetical protein
MMVVNGEESSCIKLKDLVDLPDAVELFADPTGNQSAQFTNIQYTCFAKLI